MVVLTTMLILKSMVRTSNSLLALALPSHNPPPNPPNGPMTPAASPAMDCCVALGADLRRGRLRCGGPESGLWRTWLATSSLLPGRPRAYLAVRVTLALFMDAVLLGSALLMAWAKGKWCIYLTHWSLTAVALYLTLAAFATWTAQRAAPGEPPPWWLPALWSLHAVRPFPDTAAPPATRRSLLPACASPRWRCPPRASSSCSSGCWCTRPTTRRGSRPSRTLYTASTSPSWPPTGP